MKLKEVLEYFRINYIPLKVEEEYYKYAVKNLGPDIVNRSVLRYFIMKDTQDTSLEFLKKKNNIFQWANMKRIKYPDFCKDLNETQKTELLEAYELILRDCCAVYIFDSFHKIDNELLYKLYFLHFKKNIPFWCITSALTDKRVSRELSIEDIHDIVGPIDSKDKKHLIFLNECYQVKVKQDAFKMKFTSIDDVYSQTGVNLRK